VRTMRRDTLAHYRSIGRDTERYVMSRVDESLVEAILRTVIANQDDNFPASSETMSTMSSAIRILSYIVASEANPGPPDEEEERALVSDLRVAEYVPRLEASGAYENPGGKSLEHMKRQISEKGAAILAQMADDMAALSEEQVRLKVQATANMLARRSSSRQFALSTLGFMLLVPTAAKEGDAIVIFGKVKMAYLLRPCAEYPGAYELVGEAYVHGTGVMTGQAMMDLAPEATRSGQYRWFSIR